MLFSAVTDNKVIFEEVAIFCLSYFTSFAAFVIRFLNFSFKSDVWHCKAGLIRTPMCSGVQPGLMGGCLSLD